MQNAEERQAEKERKRERKRGRQQGTRLAAWVHMQMPCEAPVKRYCCLLYCCHNIFTAHCLLMNRQINWQTDRLADKYERETERERAREWVRDRKKCALNTVMEIANEFFNICWLTHALNLRMTWCLLPDIHICLSMAAEWNLPEQVNAGECHQQALWMAIGKMWAVNIYEATYLWHMSIMLSCHKHVWQIIRSLNV